ncbi:hypothetical protein CDAR_36961, partial [Caerostris darwini]
MSSLNDRTGIIFIIEKS